MENSIYYTFSTMAQTLAGAIALLGVFILYRVQQIINELKGIAEAAVMDLETGPANNLIIVNKKNPQLISRIKKGIARNDLSGLKENLDELVGIIDNDSYKEKVQKDFASKYRFKNKIIKQTKIAIYFTISSIVISIMILFIPTKIGLWYSILIIIGFILFIISLAMNVYVVLKTITERALTGFCKTKVRKEPTIPAFDFLSIVRLYDIDLDNVVKAPMNKWESNFMQFKDFFNSDVITK